MIIGKEGIINIWVVGGGIVGLSVALYALEAGHRVTILTGSQHQAAHYAGGMLAPYSEARVDESIAFQWGVSSLQLWKKLFSRHSEQLSQSWSDAIVARETLIMSYDRGDRAQVETLHRWIQRCHLDISQNGHQMHPDSVEGGEVTSSLVSTSDIVGLEPSVNPNNVGGLCVTGEYAVDNRLLIALLTRACHDAGAQWEHREWNGEKIPADTIIDARGMGLSQCYPWLGIRGVQGEIVRLQRTQWSMPPPSRVIRGIVRGRQVYIIPRSDGVVVGATEYDECDYKPRVGGVLDLIDDAVHCVPGLRDYALAEVSACVRPVRPDGIPWVGKTEPHVIIAAGHGRHGFLLAPLTAAAVMACLDDDMLGRRDLLDPTQIMSR